MQRDNDYHEWIAPHRTRMVNCAWRILRNAADTDDVIQESLMHILEKIDFVRAHPNRASLLLRICANKALDHLRRQKHRRDTLAEIAGNDTAAPRGSGVHMAAAPRTPRQQLAESERRELLRDFLASLPAREAEAMTLHAFEELDYAEIAAAMECGESTARVLINRARQRYRMHFTLEQFRDHEPRETTTANPNLPNEP